MPRALIFLLDCYQRGLSPLLGRRCRFHPSCSQYARIAVARFGGLRGSYLAAQRVLRCQPLCRGGHDPVPMRFVWWPRPSEQPNGEHQHE